MLIIAAQLSTNHLYDLKLLKNGVLFYWNSVTLLIYKSLLERRLQINQRPEDITAGLREGPIVKLFYEPANFRNSRVVGVVAGRK